MSGSPSLQRQYRRVCAGIAAELIPRKIWEGRVKAEFAKELYFRELDRRDQLDSSSTFRVAVVTLLAGLFSYYSSAYRADELGQPWLFLLCAIGAAVAVSVAIILVVSSFIGYTWAYLAPASDLLSYYQNLVAYERDHGIDGSSAAHEFERALVERFVAAASHNVLNNNSRSEKLYLASRLIAIAVVLGLVAGLPLAVNFIAHAVIM